MSLTFGEKIEVDDLTDKINDTILGQGPYWNNLVGLYLAKIAKIGGYKVANDVMEECGLLNMGWSKVNKKGKPNE